MKSKIIVSLAVLAAFIAGTLMVRPIARAVEILAATTCKTSGACIGGKNTSNGPGVIGTSKNGYGVSASTTYPSTSGSKFSAGVLGQDLSTSGKFDVGVWGYSKKGDGVLGSSTSSSGLYGQSTNSVGVVGTSNKVTGVYGVVSGGGGAPTGVYGQDNSSNTNGAGVAGQTKVGSGVVAATVSSANTSQAILAAAPNGGYIFAGVGPGNYEVAAIDGSGNMVISGQIYTSGQCQSGCVAHRRERSSVTTSATPTIEDTGEARLTAGTAIVRIDPAFANATDPRLGYYVLITPEGDTHGLYVARKTPGGFEVRENMGGRSSVPFAYRIVAHPFGVQPTRLPLVQSRSLPALHDMTETQTAAARPLPQ